MRRPYRRAWCITTRRHLRIRPEELPTRRPTGLKIDIECLVDLFVAAGCLSSNTLPELADSGKDSISTIRRGDGCGKPYLKPSPLETL